MAVINGTISNDNGTVGSDGILYPVLVGDLRGVPENDVINGGAGTDILRGLGGNDSLNGGDGIDLLEGGDGNDRLAGDKGNDTMNGGAGDDLLFWIDGDGSDVMLGGTGKDTVQFIGASRETAPSGLKISADDILTLGVDVNSGNVLLKRTNLTPITLTIDDVEIISVSGVEGNDQLIVNELARSDVGLVQFDGFKGNDFLDARANSTAMIDAKGGEGNDILLGGKRSDFLEGGTGSDSLFGGIGSDRLTGVDLGNSVNPGRGEQDVLIGAEGADRFVLGDRGGVNNGRRIFYDDGDNTFDGGNNITTGMDGVSDFAHIVDLNRTQGDTIQLAGSASDYVIRDLDPRGPLSRGLISQDVGIFKVRPNLFSPDELIAIVQDIGSGTLNLNNRSQFVFV